MRGHKESHRVSMPPDMWERVCAFVGSGTVPSYDSPAAFIRDALVHRLQYWSSHSLGEWRGQWAVVFSSIKAAERAELVRQLRDLPAAHRTSIEEAINEGLVDIAVSGIEHLREIAELVPSPVNGELMKMAEEFESRIGAMQAVQGIFTRNNKPGDVIGL